MPRIEQLTILAVTVLPSRIVAVGDGPPPGYAGLAREHLVARVPVLVGLGQSDRTGPDYGKVTREHVKELHHLIKRVAAQKSTYFGHTRIIVELLLSLPNFKLFGSHVFLGVVMRVGDHSPQLVDIDALAALTDTLLSENWSTRRIDRDRNTRSRNGYCQDYTYENTEANIESTLDEEVCLPAFFGAQADGSGAGAIYVTF